mmetsp:Transcript_61397/g.193461  ORF Transcript_61397/g.193461 Transcript_61397/m.193461 type:complete len:235 (-) Transcript_61397:342-1046(-)
MRKHAAMEEARSARISQWIRGKAVQSVERRRDRQSASRAICAAAVWRSSAGAPDTQRARVTPTSSESPTFWRPRLGRSARFDVSARTRAAYWRSRASTSARSVGSTAARAPRPPAGAARCAESEALSRARSQASLLRQLRMSSWRWRSVHTVMEVSVPSAVAREATTMPFVLGLSVICVSSRSDFSSPSRPCTVCRMGCQRANAAEGPAKGSTKMAVPLNMSRNRSAGSSGTLA